MMLWFVLALMTAAAIFAVLWPLAARAEPGRAPRMPRASAMTLRSIATSSTRSSATAPPAGSASARRRPRASRSRAACSRPPTGRDGRRAAAGSGDVAPPRRRARGAGRCCRSAPLGLYLCARLARPARPAARRRGAQMPAEHRSLADLIAQVEAHLERNPDDGRGWEVLAPVYLRLGRFDDAVKARRNALRLLGATAEREADLGEALAAAANGIVTAEAKAAFERAVALDAERRQGALLPRPRRRAGRPARRGRRDLARAARRARRPTRPGSRKLRRAQAARRGVAQRRRGDRRRQSAASAAGPSARGHRGRRRAHARAAQRHDPRHGRAAGRAAASRTAPTSRDGCGWCAPIWCWATATRRAPPPPTRAARSRSEPDKLRRIDELVEGTWARKADTESA